MGSIIDVLPTEIIHKIIDIVAFDDTRGEEWTKTQLYEVKSCSLVCKVFLDPCRKHIFYRIDVHGGKPRSTLPSITSFARLIANNPDIADYVQEFGYASNRSNIGPFQKKPFYADQIEPIPPSFKLLSKLHSLTLSLEPRLSWNHIDSSSRSVFLHLLHLPTIKSVAIHSIDEFTFSDLLNCSNLRNLDLEEVTISENDTVLPSSNSNATLKLDTLVLETPWKSIPGLVKYSEQQATNSSTLWLANLRHVVFAAERDEDAFSIAEFLKHTPGLQEITVRIRLTIHDASSFISAVSAASEFVLTLNLELIVIGGFEHDPVYNIHQGLEQISKMNNQIQTLTITFCVLFYSAEPYSTLSADSWSLLEKVLLTSGWSSLKHVSLGIYSRSDGNEGWSEGSPDEKCQRRFPRLSSSRNLEFELFYRRV